jgi:hypothetical protein
MGVVSLVFIFERNAHATWESRKMDSRDCYSCGVCPNTSCNTSGGRST